MGLTGLGHVLHNLLAGQMAVRKVEKISKGVLHEVAKQLLGLLRVVVLLVSLQHHPLHRCLRSLCRLYAHSFTCPAALPLFFLRQKASDGLPLVGVAVSRFSLLPCGCGFEGFSFSGFCPPLSGEFHGAGERGDLVDAGVVLGHHGLRGVEYSRAVAVEEGIGIVVFLFPEEGVDGTEAWFEQFEGFVDGAKQLCLDVELQVYFLLDFGHDVVVLLAVLLQVYVALRNDLQGAVEVHLQFLLHVRDQLQLLNPSRTALLPTLKTVLRLLAFLQIQTLAEVDVQVLEVLLDLVQDELSLQGQALHPVLD